MFNGEMVKTYFPLKNILDLENLVLVQDKVGLRKFFVQDKVGLGKFLVQDNVGLRKLLGQDKVGFRTFLVQDKVGLRKFSPYLFFSKKLKIPCLM